ncbi:MAG TPA: sugar ABC transporter permease [Actinomycetes bacterium]|nr:sugar ABC transporter permease [Actinomycetes bacterium]
MVLPLVAYVLVLTLAPIIDTFRVSFSAPGQGFGTVVNYSRIFGSDVFRRAVVNTVIVALLSLTLEIGVGLTVALALNVPFRGRGFVRTITLVPIGVPTIVSGAVMLLIFARSGYLNSLLVGLSNLVSLIPGVDWHFRPMGLTVAGGWKTLFTVAVADMWKVLPIMVLIFLAGLQSIPEELYEAADVDGATKWQRFRRIVLPLLIPYITIAIILRAIDAFRIYELALVLSGRVEPVLGTYIGQQYLPPTSDQYTAAAASIILFGIIMLFIILYLRFVAARGEIR